jgi:hypothetical protein
LKSNAAAATVPAPKIHPELVASIALTASQRNKHPSKQPYTVEKLYGRGKLKIEGSNAWRSNTAPAVQPTCHEDNRIPTR